MRRSDSWCRPIQRESLSSEAIEEIGAVYELIGPYMGTTLEQFEISFMRETDPEVAVVFWRHIAAAWYMYHESYLECNVLPVEDERGLIAALFRIATGIKDEAKLKVSREVMDRLIACYDGLKIR